MGDISQFHLNENRLQSINRGNSTGSDDEEIGQSSPIDGDSFFRSNSAGSVNTPSPHNSENEGGSRNHVTKYKERRREAHTQAEQKRRDAIKRGYDALQDLVPTCIQNNAFGCKMSKATVVKKSIDYIHFLLQRKKRKEEERNALRKELIALKIMKTNYEQIVKAHHAQPKYSVTIVSDETKLQVFQAIMDRLFQTFETVSVSTFAELSACVFSWLEEYCKPQSLREIVLSVLQQLSNR